MWDEQKPYVGKYFNDFSICRWPVTVVYECLCICTMKNEYSEGTLFLLLSCQETRFFLELLDIIGEMFGDEN